MNAVIRNTNLYSCGDKLFASDTELDDESVDAPLEDDIGKGKDQKRHAKRSRQTELSGRRAAGAAETKRIFHRQKNAIASTRSFDAVTAAETLGAQARPLHWRQRQSSSARCVCVLRCSACIVRNVKRS
jgi:hypothetical protein